MFKFIKQIAKNFTVFLGIKKYVWRIITSPHIQIATLIVLGVVSAILTYKTYSVDFVSVIALLSTLCYCLLIVSIKRQLENSTTFKFYLYLGILQVEAFYAIMFPKIFSYGVLIVLITLCFYIIVFAIFPNNSTVINEHFAKEFKGYKYLSQINFGLTQSFLICAILSLWFQLQFAVKFIFFFTLALRVLELIVHLIIIFYCNTKTMFPLWNVCKYCLYFGVTAAPLAILESTSGIVEPTDHFAREWIQYKWLRYTTKEQSGLMAGHTFKLLIGGHPPTKAGTHELDESLTRELIIKKLEDQGSKTLSKSLNWPFGKRGKDEE
jgi:hypothetical protein